MITITYTGRDLRLTLQTLRYCAFDLDTARWYRNMAREFPLSQANYPHLARKWASAAGHWTRKARALATRKPTP